MAILTFLDSSKTQIHVQVLSEKSSSKHTHNYILILHLNHGIIFPIDNNSHFKYLAEDFRSHFTFTALHVSGYEMKSSLIKRGCTKAVSEAQAL